MIPSVLPRIRTRRDANRPCASAGAIQWQDGMRLTDLIGSALELKPGADMDYVLVRRENPNNRRVSVVSANLGIALADRSSTQNIALTARDTVHVFSLAFGRQYVIEPILQELQLQSQFGRPYREVSVTGRVKAPGTYPLETGMRVSDLIRAGGNLAEEAYALKAEIARYVVFNGEYRSTTVVDVNLDAILRGVESADLVLEEHDDLRISAVPEWDAVATIDLEGEVNFPGRYRIRRGETLRQVLGRAGGLTDEAFAEGAIFLREALREREQEQKRILANRLEADLTSLSLKKTDMSGDETLTTGKTLLAQLRETEAVGRLVIDFDLITAAGQNANSAGDIELREGDRLLIPKRSQEVMVIGETQQNVSHFYQPGLAQQDYINMSGGLTRHADKKLIYVVRANGAVVTGNRSRWFGRGKGSEIRPGDTIVVPLEVDRIRPLTFWGNVTQILYQAAIAAAAVKTFDR